MDPVVLGLLSLVAIVIISLFGAPIGASIGLVSAFGLWMTSGWTLMTVNLRTIPFSTAAEYAFIVVPMFVLMGNVAASAGIIESLFTVAARWLERVRGGLLVAVTLASAGFAAVSGSTVVNAAVFTRMALPEMVRQGYDARISAAAIAAAGTFAVMIPPSLGFVLYGIMTTESVGKLFMAGLLPGVLTAVVYVLLILVGVRLRPHWAPVPVNTTSFSEKLASLKTLWGMGLLVAIVLGGIYTGFMPPSVAGAVGAMGAILISLAQRRLTWASLWGDLSRTAVLTSSLFFIVISGFIFARFLTTSGFVPELTDAVSGAGIGKWEFLAIVTVTYLVLGMFIDGASMAVITLPFVYPIAQELGIDGLWFGVLFVKLVEIGAITPPVGLNLFTVVAASEGRMKAVDLIRGIMPFLLAEIIVLVLIVAFPAISTWLPAQMN
ncbi:TRAP transporter large permease [Maritimibacter sp. DP1N21-5]|uniref:TRAP transporter large permease n=1 Tax=Maritimibacter sp. DP1N21-5 TaxID=2836867 RepID=UPI001C481808|nr:TRAP transporter large permease subunit [Maritimibacter sp. DP1N21-5]MBV7408546.1 TRAP transporter large permease subunit [Maritimibacter sp. DP1N21-5]